MPSPFMNLLAIGAIIFLCYTFYRNREMTESIVVALILAFAIRTYIVQPFKIPSGSMEDTLLVGDYLLVNKFIYGTKVPLTDGRLLPIRQPKRGDVMVFEYPLDPRFDYIKRIIGLPGDRLKMVNQVVYVNDTPFTLPQEVHKGPAGYGDPRIFGFDEVTVPEGCYFAMGDNRDRSSDSRYWGFVSQERLRGTAFIKHFSVDGSIWNVRWNRIGRLIK